VGLESIEGVREGWNFMHESGSFLPKASEVFAGQSEIAVAIAEQLFCHETAPQ